MSEPKTKTNMIDQFNRFREVKGKTKSTSARGPIDVPALRQEVKSWNEKNRKPS